MDGKLDAKAARSVVHVFPFGCEVKGVTNSSMMYSAAQRSRGCKGCSPLDTRKHKKSDLLVVFVSWVARLRMC